MPPKKILHIEDDLDTQRQVAEILTAEKFDVVSAPDGETGLVLAGEIKPDLILLDMMLPGRSGRDICADLRLTTNAPILVLSVKDDEVDIVLGLEMGADDYMGKPFSPRELLARVKAVLRRANVIREAARREETLEFPGLVIDIPTHTVTLDGEGVHLTPKEMLLLYHLAAEPRRVFTRETLADLVWGRELAAGEIRTVDTHVKRIRKKLEADDVDRPWSLATVWGVGYKFETGAQ